MAIKTDTLLMLGGLGLLGFGMFYMMGRRPAQAASGDAQAATEAAIRAANVTDPMAQNQMLSIMQQLMNQVNQGMDPRVAQAQVISQYAELGIKGVEAILGAIQKFFPQERSTGGQPALFDPFTGRPLS